jgi:hypothetical protein
MGLVINLEISFTNSNLELMVPSRGAGPGTSPLLKRRRSHWSIFCGGVGRGGVSGGGEQMAVGALVGGGARTGSISVIGLGWGTDSVVISCTASFDLFSNTL